MKKKIFALLLLLFGLLVNGSTRLTTIAADLNHDNTPFKIAGNFGENADKEYLVTWQSMLNTQQLELTSYADILYSNSTTFDAVITKFELASWGYDARNLCRVNLSELTPDYSYRYRVGYGDVWSPDYTFKTQKSDSFSFIFISDPQASSLEEYKNLGSITNRAYKENPAASFFLLGGDISDIAGEEGQYDAFFQSFVTLRNLPLMSVIGNHDTMNANTNWTEIKGESRVYDAHFANPDNGPNFAKNTTYYSYVNNCLFVVLNTQLTETNLSSQAQWLDDLLKENQQQNKSKYIIVTMHRGVVGNYYYGNATINSINRIYVPIFDKYGVDLVLSGHDHNYNRTLKRYNNEIVNDKNGTGTVYIIGGATGPKFNQPKADALSQFVVNVSNIGVYTNITIDNNKISVLAKDATGKIVDSVNIPAKRNWVPSLLHSLDYDIRATQTDFSFNLSNYNFVSKIQVEKLNGDILATLTPFADHYTFNNLEAGSTYKYNIRVVYEDGSSAFQQITFTTIYSIDVQNITANTASVIFNENIVAECYKIYLDNQFIYECNKYFSSYDLINLTSKRNYTVRVDYYDIGNNIIDSDYSLFRTL